MKTFLKKLDGIPIFSAALLLIAAISLYFFIYKAIDNNERTWNEADQKWRTEISKKNEMQALAEALRSVAVERAELGTHFIQSSDVVPFLDEVEKRAGSINVKAEVTDVAVPSDSPGLLVGLKAGGSFANVYRFINLLENSPYHLRFENMTLSKGDVKTGPEWTALLQVRVLNFLK